MSIGPARVAPSVEIGPAPSYGAWSKVYWRRESAIGDETIDGRAAQPGGLDDGRHAREQACRFGSGARFQGRGVHAAAQLLVFSLVDSDRGPAMTFCRKSSRLCPM